MGLLRLGRTGFTPPAGIVVAALTLAGWLSVCALLLARAMDYPQKLAIVILLACVAIPAMLLNTARLPVCILALYAAVSPFTNLLPTGAGPTYTNLLGIVTAIVLLLSMLAKERVSIPSRAAGVVLVLAVYLGLTIFWALDPQVALTDYGRYVSQIGLYVVIALYPATMADLKTVLAGAIAGGALVAVFAIWFLLQSGNASRIYIGGAEHWIDPNELAASLLVPIALAGMLFLRARTGIAKLVWFTPILLLMSGFAASGSRGCALSLGVMALFLLFRSRYRIQLIAAVSAASIFMLASPIAQRFAQSDVSTGDQRFDVWRVGLASLHRYWLAGAGVGNFDQAFVQYFLSVPHQPMVWERVAHSVIVGSAVELGIPGLLLVMAVWYFQFVELAGVRGEGFDADMCLALRAGVLGLFMAGLSLSIMTLKFTWLAFAMVAFARSALKASGVRVDRPPVAVS